MPMNVPISGLDSPIGGETVLVVEEDAKVRASTLTVLRRLGYDALEAEDGDAALLLGERHGGPIHLLLTDVDGVTMSGSELVQRMLHLRPTMKVLYVAGYAPDAAAREVGLEADSECLTRPFSPDTLGSTIRRLLDAS
jgi:DNA-binding NtrC family response regulator